MSDFSSNLRRLRKRAGLSQDALAEKLSVTRQTVSSWERGNSYPDLDMLVRISDALATDPNELLYPNQKRRSGGVSRLVDDDFFGKLTVVIWIVGFLLGLPAGSQGYASGPNTISWHFVFSDALRCWAPAFLTGMAFLGLQKIIDLLKERGEGAGIFAQALAILLKNGYDGLTLHEQEKRIEHHDHFIRPGRDAAADGSGGVHDRIL